ncbi:MAG: methyltransferase domain-containing protein [Actinomycetota bacterium]|nr:methyltransferase domain-containing protein [Actinomycetota bacterium]
MRLRPALDLLAQVDHRNPKLVYDVGTGGGEMARLMAQRWPEATVVGTDTSVEMLGKAAATPSRVKWKQHDVQNWGPTDSPDIIYSNAVLHWVPEHDSLLIRLVDSLAPGGVLAIQMPLSWGEPSHRLMREVLATAGADGAPLGSVELRSRMGRCPVGEPAHYHRLLSPVVDTVEIWTTRYLQVLEGPDPVLEWVKGTALRPVLDELTGAELESFLERYRREVRSAYEQGPDGTTLFPFPRLFIVAHK